MSEYRRPSHRLGLGLVAGAASVALFGCGTGSTSAQSGDTGPSVTFTSPRSGESIADTRNGINVTFKATGLNGKEVWVLDSNQGDDGFTVDDNGSEQPGPIANRDGVTTFDDNPYGDQGNNHTESFVSAIVTEPGSQCAKELGAVTEANDTMPSIPKARGQLAAQVVFSSSW